MSGGHTGEYHRDGATAGTFGTNFLETEALLAILDGNDDAAEEILGRMLPGELQELAAAAGELRQMAGAAARTRRRA